MGARPGCGRNSYREWSHGGGRLTVVREIRAPSRGVGRLTMASLTNQSGSFWNDWKGLGRLWPVRGREKAKVIPRFGARTTGRIVTIDHDGGGDGAGV